MLSIASPAAAPQPERVLMIIKLCADANEVIVSQKIFTNRSDIGAFCCVLTAYLYLPVGDSTLISCSSLMSRDIVACVTSNPSVFSIDASFS